MADYDLQKLRIERSRHRRRRTWAFYEAREEALMHEPRETFVPQRPLGDDSFGQRFAFRRVRRRLA